MRRGCIGAVHAHANADQIVIALLIVVLTDLAHFNFVCGGGKGLVAHCQWRTSVQPMVIRVIVLLASSQGEGGWDEDAAPPMAMH